VKGDQWDIKENRKMKKVQQRQRRGSFPVKHKGMGGVFIKKEEKRDQTEFRTQETRSRRRKFDEKKK